MFLHDPDPFVVLEAARAINDEPINGAAQDLAALITNTPSNSLSSTGGEGRGEEEALLRRILNANFHVGTTHSAKALASYAARTDAPDNMRVEALQQLADWEHPSRPDRLVALWRPVPAPR